MLRSNDSPDGCPKLMFQSVALSVLSCFSQDEEIMTHPSVLFNLPVILDIITNADDEAYEENLMIIKDAYICLNSVVAFDKGRLAFINNRGMQSLCVVITKQASLNFPTLFSKSKQRQRYAHSCRYFNMKMPQNCYWICYWVMVICAGHIIMLSRISMTLWGNCARNLPILKMKTSLKCATQYEQFCEVIPKPVSKMMDVSGCWWFSKGCMTFFLVG